jgi:competence protein ComEC
MNFWHQFPFIRIIIPFVAGILTAIIPDFPFHVPVILLISLVIIIGLLLLVPADFKKRWLLWLTGIMVNAVLFFSGYQLTEMKTPKLDPTNISGCYKQSEKYLIQLTEPITERPNSFKVIAKVLAFSDSLGWKSLSGKVMIYFEKDTLAASLEYGDKMVMQAQFKEVEAPKNPEEFNYKRYLSNKGIYHQGFIRGGNWKLLESDCGNPVYQIAYRVRMKLLTILESNHIKGAEYAVASAILLGYDEYLDSEQKADYSGSGAMHILCVSGLHVGIIVLIFERLLFYLNRRTTLRVIKVLVIVLIVWFYALITGLSPSVLRASAMFSFLVMGKSMKRKPDAFNTLALSAFALLVLDPYMLTDVGFQLSYLAVAGILLLYQPVYKLFLPNNRVLDYFWQTTAVSIAATVTTFPLSILYFHQFPNLFLLTNLVAIPLSMVIIAIGLLVLFFSFFPLLSGLLAKILVFTIWFLNHSVSTIENLPIAVTRGLFINFYEAIFIFLALSGVVYLINIRSRKVLFFILPVIILLFGSFTFRKVINLNHKNIVVYNIRNSTAIDFISGRNNVLLTDSLLLSDKSGINYHISNHWVKCGIKYTEHEILQYDFQKEYLYKSGNLLQFYDKTIALTGDMINLNSDRNKVKTDFLILTSNFNMSVSSLAAVFDFSELIIDSSSPRWKINEWTKECDQLGIRYHSTADQGAWMKSW